jgi:hypothetical protein
MSRNCRVWVGALALLVLFHTRAALAAPDKVVVVSKTEAFQLLPNDSEYVLTVNIRKAVDSPLLKGYVPWLKLALRATEYKDFLPAGFDLFKHIDSMTCAGPISVEKEKGLAIFTGKFDVAQFQKHGEETAKKKPKLLKITKLGDARVWEITTREGEDGSVSRYALLLDKHTLLLAGSKDYLKDALAKAAGKKKTELKKELKALLEKADQKLTVSAVFLTSPLAKVLANVEVGGMPAVPDEANGLLDKLKGISAGIMLGDDLKILVGIGTKDKEAAQDMTQKVNLALLIAPIAIGRLANQNDQLASYGKLLKEVIRATRAKRKDDTVNITLTLTKDFIKKVEKMIKEGEKKNDDK